MFRKLKWILGFGLIFVLIFGLVGQAFATGDNESPVSGRMIVMFEKEFVNEAAQEALVKKFGGVNIKSLPSINGLAVMLPPQAADGIAHNPNVLSVEPDCIVETTFQNLPWCVDRIDADIVHATNKGTGVKVAVIDTGVDYTHPDLAGNFDPNLLGYDFVNEDADPMDDYGHGTHVAGTIAAEDNDIGVVGVAPEADLYALKVLDSSGSGYYSDIIEALAWCVDNGIQVANMSLGGSDSTDSLRAACDNAYNAGVLLVAAAGNSGTDTVYYPAGYDSVIAVSATDPGDVRASFSSYGNHIELAAHGVTVYSTWPGGQYVLKSGTSMAAPHIVGTAALVIASGITGSSAVRDQLDATAEDLGEEGWDQYYGYGLVDAEAAASSPIEKGRLSGTVTDIITEKPIVDADVTAGGYSATTASDGTYNLDLPVGTYTVTVSKSGYFDASQPEVKLQEAATSVANFALILQPTGTIGGIVKDEVGAPVANAFVTTGESSTTTIDGGSYVLSDLPVGKYTITVSAQGYYSDSEEGVEVLENLPASVDFTLVATPSTNENDMYVRSIILSKKEAGPNVFLSIDVNIARDSNVNGMPDNSDFSVGGATVELLLSTDKGEWLFTGVTDSNGMVSFILKKAPKGEYVVNVENLKHTTYTWSQGLDTQGIPYTLSY